MAHKYPVRVSSLPIPAGQLCDYFDCPRLAVVALDVPWAGDPDFVCHDHALIDVDIPEEASHGRK